jgi:hypothetical protein
MFESSEPKKTLESFFTTELKLSFHKDLVDMNPEMFLKEWNELTAHYYKEAFESPAIRITVKKKFCDYFGLAY